ncbi:hypothetical protein D7S86_14780 [Pararobbsia silviterrae]|uniref:Uncharacterized protein n=1 Tax=Pararobbsia silviterrae TaxID=1792498 RepID=A0A494XZE1_9BURK|nr:hypothetical protein D7S86_14780 [Pararobbsia silviterrae]
MSPFQTQQGLPATTVLDDATFDALKAAVGRLPPAS